MKLSKVDAIATAVLYEGHVLYPYRPSSKKDRVRWAFGGIHPRDYSQAIGGSEPDSMQTQVLVLDRGHASVEVMVRFLHLVQRTVGRLLEPAAEAPRSGEPAWEPVQSLRLGEASYLTWQEALERSVETDVGVAELLAAPQSLPAAFPASRRLEWLHGPGGMVEGVLVREQESIDGVIELNAEEMRDNAVRLTVRVRNETPMPDAASADRDRAMMVSMASTHTILGVDDGEFVSLADPVEGLGDLAATCDNQGTWPVMVGSPGDTDMMLSSRIIVEDYPRVTAESPRDLFDGEIDEILTLRIRTLTDEERAEAMAADESVRALLERTEALLPEELTRRHGVVRGMRPPGGGDEKQ